MLKAPKNLEEACADPVVLLALVNWREARGEPTASKYGQACSVRNRANKPSWWGTGYVGVILKPWQYSSFNPNDPNSSKWPQDEYPSWQECCTVAEDVYSGVFADNTEGATSYFDKSLDAHPPKWATPDCHTVDLGSLHFYKVI